MKVASLPDPLLLQGVLDGKPIDAMSVKARGRRKALLIADMDSTIVTGETLDELAGFAGIRDQIAAITSRAMNGELDFKAALRERVAMLRGLPIDALEKTWRRVRLTPGARELVATMRARGALTALVSGGFSFFTGKVAAELGFDVHRSNTLLQDESGADRASRRTDPGPRQQAVHVDRAGGTARREAVGNTGGWRRGQRSGHAARGGARVSHSMPSRSSRGRLAPRWITPTFGPCCSPRVTRRRCSSPIDHR